LQDKVGTQSPPLPVLVIQRSNTFFRRFDKSFENEITGVLIVQEEESQLVDFGAPR